MPMKETVSPEAKTAFNQMLAGLKEGSNPFYQEQVDEACKNLHRDEDGELRSLIEISAQPGGIERVREMLTHHII